MKIKKAAFGGRLFLFSDPILGTKMCSFSFNPNRGSKTTFKIA
jgi:hypothetical protein